LKVLSLTAAALTSLSPSSQPEFGFESHYRLCSPALSFSFGNNTANLWRSACLPVDCSHRTAEKYQGSHLCGFTLGLFYKDIPATSYRQLNGVYNNDIFPFPTKLIQSVFVPAGEAIIGIGKRYFMGLGTGKGGKIEYSDDYHFLEDERVYLTKLYGDGKPLDASSFIRLDISNLKPTPLQVHVTNDELGVNIANELLDVRGISDARLSSLTLGSLSLSPSFNKSVFVYTAATSNATNTVTP
jgi:hypothetical protein